jgi:type IV pilus assembly protein PilW
VTRTRGFSLVELMVAIALGLFVTAAIVSVFVGTRTVYQSTGGTAALTDGGRFALDFIESSVRDAGFMACSRSLTQTTLLNPGPTPLYFNFGEALGGFEAVATAPGGGAYTVAKGSLTTPVAADSNATHWIGGLDAALVTPTPLVVTGNDVLVVRSTLQNTQPVYVTAITDGAVSFTVTTQGGLQPNQFAVISDCANSLSFQITAVAASGINEIITHGTGGSPGNTTSSFLPLSFGVGSQVTAVDTVVYYIGTGADGDGALFSADLYNPATQTYTGGFNPSELVPDIEAMQVLYGLDTTGSQTVSEYVTADKVTDFNSVMSVKVAVLAASSPGAVKAPTVAPTYNLLGTVVTAPLDTRARQEFEVTIAVRNALN